MGVKVAKFFVQRMKTKWGSCNHRAGNIRLNLEPAKKSPECFEYIVVHEMVHLLEPTHNQRFVTMMDRFLPNWQFCRDALPAPIEPLADLHLVLGGNAGLGGYVIKLVWRRRHPAEHDVVDMPLDPLGL